METDGTEASLSTSLRIRFIEGGNDRPVGMDLRPGPSNFFMGKDPSRWAVGARTFSRVIYNQVWKGIDLVYYLDHGRLKYDLVVKPGSDTAHARFHVEGHRSLSVSNEGCLVFSTPLGCVSERAPVAYLEGETSALVACDFDVASKDTYGFSVGEYDRSRTLIIDPLVNSTFLGGGDREDACSVSLGTDGSVLVTGYTRSQDLPITEDALFNTSTGGSCAYVSKFDPDLSVLIYSTYIGGSDWDYGRDVGMDPSGNVYVAGMTTSHDFPTTTGAYQENISGSWDAFVCRLSPDGSELLYSTLVGGEAKDHASYLPVLSMVVDASGCVYISSSTESDDFPTTDGAFQRTRAGNADAYICKIAANGSALEFSTLMGGSDWDYSYGLAVSDVGEAFICGQTASDDLPSTKGVYQENHTGDFTDIFVCQLASNGSTLEYLTYVGGWGQEDARSIAVDSQGAAYIHGFAIGANFPTTEGSYAPDPSGAGDAIVFKLDPDCEKLEYSTYLGGSSYEEGSGIALDSEGNAYLAGRTSSQDFPTTPGCDQDIHKGSYDGYVSVLDPDGSDLSFSTYLGSARADVPFGTAFDGNASLYVCGYTDSSGFPTKAGGYQTVYAGGQGDAFVSRLVLDVIAPEARAGKDLFIDQHETVTFNGSASRDNLGIANLTWRFVYDGIEVVLGGLRPSFTFHTAGRYVVNLTVTDVAGNVAWDLLNVTVRDITPPVPVAGDNVTINQFNTVLFDGSGSSDNVGISVWTWTFSYVGSDVRLVGVTASFTFQEAGIYVVMLNVTDAMGNWATDNVTVRVIDVTAPVADAGRDLRIDQNETVTFDGTGSRDNVGVTNWTWGMEYEGRNITLYGARPEFTFDEPGVYTVLLTVHDAEGNFATDSMTVEVRDTQRPVADAGGDMKIDQDHTVVFNGSGSSDNVAIDSFEWSFEYDNMTVRLQGDSPNFFFHTAGEYTIMLIVTDLAGNWASDFVTVTVTDVTKPIADAGLDMTVDQHETVTLDGSGSWDNSYISRWRWTFHYRGSDMVLEGARPIFIFDDAGVYEITLIVNDPFRNEDNDTLTVTVNDITPPVADAGPDVNVPQQTTVELNGSASYDNLGIETFNWSFEYGGTEITAEGEVQSFLFVIPGRYRVRLEVVDAMGSSAIAYKTIRVRDTEPPIAVAPRDRTVGLGERVTFDASSSSDNVGIVNWTWTVKFPGYSYIEVLEGPSVDYTFDEPGRHRVSLMVSDAEGNTDLETFIVTVEDETSWWWVLPVVIAAVFVASAAIVRRRKGPAPPGSEG